MKTKTTRYDVAEHLRNPREMAAYLQAMLEDLPHKRRVEAWRKETAAEANVATKAVRAGKLKSQSAESAIASLRGAT